MIERSPAEFGSLADVIHCRGGKPFFEEQLFSAVQDQSGPVLPLSFSPAELFLHVPSPLCLTHIR